MKNKLVSISKHKTVKTKTGFKRVPATSKDYRRVRVFHQSEDYTKAFNRFAASKS